LILDSLRTPEGLENVSKFPNIFAALIETGRWSELDMEHLAGKNILRVIQEVEHVKSKYQNLHIDISKCI